MSCDEEALSEYLDGELAEPSRRELEAHVAACPSCRSTLERLRSASAAFREHAAVKVPPGLASEALRAPARETKGRELRWAPAALVSLLSVSVLLVGGKMFKPQISGIFNQTMGMISGAASTVGGGGPPAPAPVLDVLIWSCLALAILVLGLWLRSRRAPEGRGSQARGRGAGQSRKAVVTLVVCVLALLATTVMIFGPSIAAIFDQILGMISAASSTVGSGG